MITWWISIRNRYLISSVLSDQDPLTSGSVQDPLHSDPSLPDLLKYSVSFHCNDRIQRQDPAAALTTDRPLPAMANVKTADQDPLIHQLCYPWKKSGPFLILLCEDSAPWLTFMEWSQDLLPHPFFLKHFQPAPSIMITDPYRMNCHITHSGSDTLPDQDHRSVRHQITITEVIRSCLIKMLEYLWSVCYRSSGSASEDYQY